jgi:hypothetical protein
VNHSRTGTRLPVGTKALGQHEHDQHDQDRGRPAEDQQQRRLAVGDAVVADGAGQVVQDRVDRREPHRPGDQQPRHREAHTDQALRPESEDRRVDHDAEAVSEQFRRVHTGDLRGVTRRQLRQVCDTVRRDAGRGSMR